jgi:hypothetical protein
MKLIVKNPSSDDCSYFNNTIVVPAGSSLDVSPYDWFSLYSDHIFWKDLKENNVTINDSVRDYNLAEAEEYLKLIVSDFNYNNKDTDGALITRNKAAKKGWSFWAVPIEFTTSTLGGSLFIQDSNGNPITWVSCKIYDANNNEITTAGVLNANLNACVKTVIDFEPTFNYEIIGGSLRVNSNPASDVRVWIIGAPDIPAIYGGSKEFASGVNLKFLSADSPLEVDGRVTKALFYDANTHQGKMRFIFKHAAGTQVNSMMMVEIYRQ